MGNIKRKRLNILFLLFISLFIIGCNRSDYEVNNDYKCPDCNVVIILVDALRFDHLGCYGYKKNTSPNIDKLCDKGIVFENAISQAPWTKPSVTSLFTSNYLQTHNINRFTTDFTVGGADNVLPSSALTLAEILSNNSLKTKAIIGNYFIEKGFGLEQGFDDYDGQYSDEVITNKAIDYINKNKKNKFFLYLHYMAPHSTWDPPLEYKKKFKANYTGTIDFRIKHQQHLDINKMSKEDLEELRARYDGEINYIDNEIKKLLNYLKNQNLTNKTLIVFLADHGEALKENDKVGHGFLVNTVIQVPLVIIFPNINKRINVENIVELIDIAPTILSVLKIKVPGRFQGINIFEEKKKFSFSESRHEGKAIRTKDFIFKINNSSQYALYNLQLDPFEFKNIKEENPAVVNEFLKAYEIYKRLPKQNLDSKEIDKETLEQLKALGYIN